MKFLYLFLFLLIFISDLFAQKEAYNWDYGSLNVLTFDTPSGEPEMLVKSIMPRFYNNAFHTEGNSSISDSSGNFLFSTNGTRIYNYLGTADSVKDENSSDIALAGSFSSTQAALIVKKPGSDNIFYIFTTDAELTNGVLGYTVIELNRSENKINVISLNNELNINSTEKLIGIKHANGRDVWIITTIRNSNYYYAYLLTENGITDKPVKSNTGIYWDIGTGRGYMKSNIKGDLIANTININEEGYTGNAFKMFCIDIMKFDKLTGKLSSQAAMQFDTLKVNYLYGLEFSPDSKKLYICSNMLFQLDISILDSSLITQSFTVIKNLLDDGSVYGALQLAPNGKIYFARSLSLSGKLTDYMTLGVINKPNLSGLACNYSSSGTTFLSSASLGLPNFVQGLFDFSAEIIGDSVCLGDDLILTSRITPDITSNKYTWTAPDGKQYNGKSLKISNAEYSDAGLYKLSVDINSTIRTDSAFVVVFGLPAAKINGDLFICKNGSTILQAETSKNYKYKWSTGETTDFITVTKAGKYYLSIENENGCKSTDSVVVSYRDDLSFKISGQNNICIGDTLILKTDLTGKGYRFEWSTGDKTAEIKITKGAKYIVNVTSDAGCVGKDSIDVAEFEKPDLKFEKEKYTICNGDSILISPVEIKSNFEYEWSDGLKTTTRIIKKTSDLYLVAKSGNGCEDTAFVKVEVLNIPTAKITADKTEACFGEKITLKAENFNAQYEYLWSTGEKSESIIISQSGKYSLKVSNKNLCVDSTSIDIIIYPDLNLELITDKTTLCFDDSTTISSKLKYDKYLWSTGDTIESIKINAAGVYKLIVQNEFGCRDTAQIEIFKYNTKLNTDIETLTFNELCLGSSDTKFIKFTIQSDNELIVSSIYLKSNIFSIDKINSFLKAYKNGETIDIPVLFKPHDAGEFYDTLVIESNYPCNIKKEIPIYGSSKAQFEFSLPNITAEAGSYQIIPIYAGLTCPNSYQLNSDYEIEISFDKEYFSPDSVKYGELFYNKIDNLNRIIKIKGNTEFKDKKDPLVPINYIYGMALLGRKDTVPLVINYVNFKNKRYFPQYINGSLIITGCVNKISKIQIFKPTKLSISPNPTDGEVKMLIGSQEHGTFKIEIFNIQGQSIYNKEFIKSNSSYEEFEYFCDTKEIGSGIYSIHLTSPWNMIIQQLVISK